MVLFENSIVCQCTFFKYFFMRHGTFVCCLVVVVVLWCLLFVCTSSLRLDAFLWVFLCGWLCKYELFWLWWFFLVGCAMIVFFCRFLLVARFWLCHFFDAFGLIFYGEFDPGSGRTLAACLTHASRTERLKLAWGLEWRTGE